MKKIKLFTLLLIIMCALMTNVFASNNNGNVANNNINITNNNDNNKFLFESLNLPRIEELSDIDENDFVPGEYYDFNLTHEENVERYRQMLNTHNFM